MSHPHNTTHNFTQNTDRATSRAAGTSARRRTRWHRVLAVALPLAALSAGYAGAQAASPAAANPSPQHGVDHKLTMGDRAAAMLATAGFQDVAVAEDAGYVSSIDTLGCFQSRERGGMGVHYVNGDLMDATVDITEPEALVYELDAAGEITGLVAHEYIVPVDAWTSTKPPALFGIDFHQHPTLPLWVLHAWLWKGNPAGVFEDWNPAVRLCPTDVPVFGTDLPAPAP
jgi:hypothetical protein